VDAAEPTTPVTKQALQDELEQDMIDMLCHPSDTAVPVPSLTPPPPPKNAKVEAALNSQTPEGVKVRTGTAGRQLFAEDDQ
jgi:hypothetical protein